MFPRGCVWCVESDGRNISGMLPSHRYYNQRVILPSPVIFIYHMQFAIAVFVTAVFSVAVINGGVTPQSLFLDQLTLKELRSPNNSEFQVAKTSGYGPGQVDIHRSQNTYQNKSHLKSKQTSQVHIIFSISIDTITSTHAYMYTYIVTSIGRLLIAPCLMPLAN